MTFSFNYKKILKIISVSIVFAGASFVLALLVYPISRFKDDEQPLVEKLTFGDAISLDNKTLFLDGYQREDYNHNYIIRTSSYFHADPDRYMRDQYDFKEEDTVKVYLYKSSQASKLFKELDVLKILHESYPDEYIVRVSQISDNHGKSYLSLETKSVNNQSSNGRGKYSTFERLLDIDSEQLISGIVWASDDGQADQTGLVPNDLAWRLNDRGIKILGTDNQVTVDFYFFNTKKLKDLNISSDKAYMDLFKDKKSGTLVFFGDDALERVAHLLARSDQTDMFTGTKLAADESSDGQEHELTSIADYRALRK